MSASTPLHNIEPIDAIQVADFLRQNPDFFTQHAELLSELDLPHGSTGSVSLVERQVSVLRERNGELRTRLTKLVEAARDNDRLFELTRRLVLDLLLADDLPCASKALDRSMREDFQVDVNGLCLLGESNQQFEHHRVAGFDEARESIAHLLEAKQVICGTLRKEETQFLFGDDASKVASAAVVPIGAGQRLGLLAVGSADPQHYKNGMGTLFLSYIGEILAHALPRYL